MRKRLLIITFFRWLFKHLSILPAASMLLLCNIAFADNIQGESLRSGSGFFITQEYLVTNEHVANSQCAQIIVRINDNDTVPARLIAIDAKHDLALLRSPKFSSRQTMLRRNMDAIKVGDKVVAAGYPVNVIATGTYELASAQLLNISDSEGDTDKLQFSHSTEQGYSGGPLLDRSGNLVGVTKGEVKKYEKANGKEEAKTLVSDADEAVSSAILKAFLASNGIPYLEANSTATLTDKELEALAQNFTVGVQCTTGTGNLSPILSVFPTQDTLPVEPGLPVTAPPK